MNIKRLISGAGLAVYTTKTKNVIITVTVPHNTPEAEVEQSLTPSQFGVSDDE